jgi:hypothetical protein
MFTNQTVEWTVGLLAGLILVIIIITNIVAKFQAVPS